MLKPPAIPLSMTAAILLASASALALATTFLSNKVWPGSLLAALAGAVLFLGMLRFRKAEKFTTSYIGFVLAVIPPLSGPPMWALLQIVAATVFFYAIPSILFRKWLPASIPAGS